MNRREFLLGVGLVGFWDDPRIKRCCDIADAVYADDWVLLGDKVHATVTGEGPEPHPWAPIGDTFIVPPEKVEGVSGNPTGHALLFLTKNKPHTVFCFVPGAGI